MLEGFRTLKISQIGACLADPIKNTADHNISGTPDICVNVRDRMCLFVRPLSSPGPLEIWKHEWYHVVTNCQGHVLSPSGLPKVAKKRQKKPKFAFPYKYS